MSRPTPRFRACAPNSDRVYQAAGKCPDRRALLVDEVFIYDDNLVSEFCVDRRQIENHVEPGLFGRRHEKWRYDGPVYPSTGQGSGSRSGIANLQDLHVFVWFHAPLADEETRASISG